MLEEADPLKFSVLLQMSKPNKSIDIRFRTEDFLRILRVPTRKATWKINTFHELRESS